MGRCLVSPSYILYTQSPPPKAFQVCCFAQGSHAIGYFLQNCAQPTVYVSFCFQVTPARRGFHLYFLRASRRTLGALRVLGHRSTGKVSRVGRARRCNRRVGPLKASLLVVVLRSGCVCGPAWNLLVVSLPPTTCPPITFIRRTCLGYFGCEFGEIQRYLSGIGTERTVARSKYNQGFVGHCPS